MTPSKLNLYGLPKLGFSEESLGLTGNPLVDQIAIESLCLRIEHAEHEGGLGPFGHFKNYVDLLWNNPESGSMKRCIWNPWANRMFRYMLSERELSIAGSTSAGKSDPAALYSVVRYTTDPTHTLVLVMSTTIKGAKKRIWKTLIEYWESITGLPGKHLRATNEIRGLNYTGSGYGESSGIFLLASEQSAEKAALDKIIGIKAPRTGEPDENFERLISKPEYADLREFMDEEALRELVPRLHNLSNDRIGKLILVIDEMTGMAESILNAVNTNLKPGNVGHFQIVGLGNPDSIYDPFGLFSKPEGGWDKVDLLRDTEWTTETGGTCIRFNGEENPRIIEGDERYSWMLRREDIEAMEKKYGRQSGFYHRMVLGTWCLTNQESGIYTPADIEMSGAKETSVIWGFQPPVPVSYLDPSFTAGGDLAWATFGLLGKTHDGREVLLIEEDVVIKTDPTNTLTPVNYQIVREWRKECENRGVSPENAAYDRSGGGIPFGDIVTVVWSPKVMGITSGGKASTRPVPGERDPRTNKPILACERYANKATELWYGAHPYLRSSQIYGISDELAKELCSRQHAKGKTADGRTLCVESKRQYKDREGKSPDQSDSFLGLVELCRERLGFISSEGDEVRKQEATRNPTGQTAWKQLQERARRMSKPRQLRRKP